MDIKNKEEMSEGQKEVSSTALEPVTSVPENDTYDEVTVSKEEIDLLKKTSPDVDEKQGKTYHNSMLGMIQTGIRKAAKNQEKEVFYGSHKLQLERREFWKRGVMQSLERKFKEKGVNAEFDADLYCFTVKL